MEKSGEKLEVKMDEFDEKTIEEAAKSAKSLIQTFLQTVKGYRLYESNHPILVKFLERLKKDFDKYFEEYDAFTLQIGEHQLLYHGKVVYESQDVKESLAFVFYKDGIRELRFYRGMEFNEILDFLTVVRKSDLVNRMEDDLVTLLWEKDFSHIVFNTVDEFLDKGAISVPTNEQDLLSRLEFKPDAGQQGEAEEPKPDPFQVLTDEGLRQALNPSPGQTVVQACQLNPDEAEMINQEVQREQSGEYLQALNSKLIEILLHLGEDMDAYENMISYFDRMITSLLTRGQIDDALTILNALMETMESIVLKDKQIFAIRRVLEGASHPKAVELLGKAMQGNGELPAESIVRYFPFLTKQAIQPLCVLLGELGPGKWEKLISDHLATLCKEDIQPLTRFLSERNPVLLCQILQILGKIGHPSTVKFLGSLVIYPDAKVREETLQVVAKLGEKGRPLVQKFLRDSAAEIRSKASLIFAKTARDQAVKPLVEIILSEDFLKRDYNEKASFFRALGETGSKEAIPVLKKIANKRMWFKRATWSEMKLCASNTLRIMGA